MSDILYSSYKSLPAYIELEAQAQLLKQAYNIGVDALKDKLKQAENEFVAARTLARENAVFNYSVIATDNDTGRHYNITRTIIDPLIGDDEFNKPIHYGSFRIVNNVFISTGGGYQFQRIKTGDIVDDMIIEHLDEGVIPDIFKQRPKIVEKVWSSGT